MELSGTMGSPPGLPASLVSSSPCIPLIARVYLKLGTWHWALSPALDDETIQG